uniref:Leprecan-like alpha-helical domain-containing protein n=2 Tax=Timema TaxID=61471 RepID=A0A7R9IPY9_9NEOP|nr:unnamed protein product [Timema tahoe]
MSPCQRGHIFKDKLNNVFLRHIEIQDLYRLRNSQNEHSEGLVRVARLTNVLGQQGPQHCNRRLGGKLNFSRPELLAKIGAIELVDFSPRADRASRGRNPDDQAMMNNLKFYSSLPEVDMNTIVNFEVKNYVPLYIHGSEAYRNEDFQSVIGYIEESLDELLKEEEECRAFCEGPFDQGWFPDFVSSISKSALNRIKEAVTECAKDVCGSAVVKETVREKKDAYKQMMAVKSETERKRLWDINKRKRVLMNAKTVVKESKEQIRLNGERMLNNFEGNKQFWEWKSSLQVEAAYPSAIHAVGCGMYDTVKNLQKACEAVSSYLLFFPNDETMLSNKKFYLTMPKVKPEYFTPRKVFFYLVTHYN